MKKIMLMVVLAASTLCANSQVYIGGGFSFESYTLGKQDVDGAVDQETQTAFGFLPEVGYKLSDKMAVGMQIGYIHKGNLDGVKDKKKNTFQIAPYFRYTFVQLGKVGIFADAQFAYSTSKTSQKYDNSDGTTTTNDYKSDTWSIGVKPGVSIALNDKLSLVTKIGWLGYQSTKNDGYKASSDFGFAVNGGCEGLGDLEFSLFYNF